MEMIKSNPEQYTYVSKRDRTLSPNFHYMNLILIKTFVYYVIHNKISNIVLMQINIKLINISHSVIIYHRYCNIPSSVIRSHMTTT